MSFDHLIEEKIKQSIERGDFDYLPGKGKPLPKDDLAHVPDELRNSYRILKNAHMLPEEMQVKKEIVEIEELIETIDDPLEKAACQKRLSEKRIRFDLLMERRKWKQSGSFRQYQNQINKRLGF
ncbi:DUF1992 domain-containing protein [Halobacillus locisalis]|uniref:DUF1992 domain-containing protein n=1 Tax=Halobacillus locisalis TaxID=220753 RepID=A0A838CWY2_9BACI|nr:DUF1992 domain-containing protein [Halobacillus locisalis]MBA2176438.1 DUF1992 domain-containing protein [Halobacillus locisalis]